MNTEHWIVAGILFLMAGVSLHFIVFPKKDAQDAAKHMQWQVKMMGFDSTITATPTSYKLFRWWGILMLLMSLYLSFYLVLDIYYIKISNQCHGIGFNHALYPKHHQ